MEIRNTKTVVRERGGFTLIEALTLLFIFTVITTTFYSVFSTGTAQIIESKNRLGAIAVANEKMEIIRNLDYEDIGTKRLQADGSYLYGVPPGEILEYESVAVNTRTFSIHTALYQADDDYDGLAPVDTTPFDYKKIKMDVSWGDGGASRTVSLVSTFVPKGVEVPTGGGTLSINVIDNAGVGVPQATVRITNSSVSPATDTTMTTNNDGNLAFLEAKASAQSYRLEVSKNGYYGVTTYAPYPTSAYVPVDVHASVVASAFNQKTVVMDRSSALTITTKDPFGADLPDIGFHLVGGRKLGDTIASGSTPSAPMYSLDQDLDSGSDAEEILGDQSSGAYAFTLVDTSRYRLLRLSADEAVQNVFSLSSGAAGIVDAFIIDTNVPAALVSVTTTVSGESVPIASASVHLSNVLLAYDATIVTDQYGQAYFPENLPALAAGTYDYTVTMSGYADKTGTIVIESGLKTETVDLISS